ncbi:hypothetical protein A2U01_0114081, partial [Trifolium medium]|nr:hypothetical protein [Trifolium medium]
MKLRDAPMAEPSWCIFQLTGATRHPLLRDAQMTEALNFPSNLLARRAILS